MKPRDQIELLQFIGRAEPQGLGPVELIRGIGQRLNQAGLPMMRIGAGFPTLHPTVVGFDVYWSRHDDFVEKSSWQRSAIPDTDFELLPFSHMSRNELSELREDLTGNRPSRFPLIQKLKEEGATGYFATNERNETGGENSTLRIFFTSWATDRTGGFTDEDISVISSLVPSICTAIRAMSSSELAYDLLRTYLGRNAAKKVIDGSVERGTVEAIDAAIIFADLAGFTQLADQRSKEELVDFLNDYFDVLVTAVRDHGGEALKFIGDGLLAIFPMDGGASVTKSALDASIAILERSQALSENRRTEGKITADVSMALHRGELLFGNVGSSDRLDFTVIGPAVNEASRIESLCRGEQQQIIVSSAFAESAQSEFDRLVSIGRFALRGVQAPQRLYTVDWGKR